MLVASSIPPAPALLPSPSQNPTCPPSLQLRPTHHRRLLLLGLATSSLPLLLHAIPAAAARGLFQMPPARLSNRYFLVRAGESVYEGMGLLNTNPVTKTSIDSGLSPEGRRQATRAAVELQRLGACSGSCWIWPSITQRAYQAAEIIASVNGINRSRIVPEYSFLDARGVGAFEGKSLDTVSELYASDGISTNNKPPPIRDGTPNESVSDVYVRITQLMSILETQYSEETIVIVSPDSDNLSILQAGLTGIDLRRVLLS
ncbi:uncharacterized protein LOC110030377 isoform X2 [Phalaenopsis equestris]|uniref:uncharacterized protein LOC110030377 isoform X2 n=1 Tax=Phalaenopsis equestris TaxID=78828 RepID=UPI0009E53B14|nr:uncharacterized protein LOC110030377 isoform X2 [Phalaenopsis equestris]